MKKQFHLTQQGVDELKKELAELIALRSEIAGRIKTAREFGDLSENMEYSAARQDQERNEARISEIEHILATSQPQVESHLHQAKALFDTKVHWQARHDRGICFA